MARTTKGLSALAGLAVLVIGVPVTLSAAGEGVPNRLPGLRRLHAALGQPLTDSALLRGVSMLCWLIWALFVIALVFEAIAQAGARAGKVRVRIPCLHRAASTLLVSAMLLLPQRALAAAGPAPGNPPAASAVVRSPAANTLRQAGQPGLARVAHDSPFAHGRVRYVVERYDSPWRIAERFLGDGTRWREIRDQGGHPLGSPPADGLPTAPGRVPTAIIHPGDIVLLPANAHLAAPGSGGAAPHAGVVSASRTPATSARDVPPLEHIADPAAAASRAASAVTSTGPGTMTSPAAVIPPTSAPPPTRPAPPEPAPLPTGPLAVGASAAGEVNDGPPPSTTAPDIAPAPSPAAVRHPRRPLSTTLVEAGLLSAAALTTLDAFRRRQARHRPQGRRIRLPGRGLDATERALRAGAQPGRLEVIERAVQRLVADLQQNATPPPTVVALVAGATWLEVLIDQPVRPPPPWISTGQGFRWRIATNQLPARDPARSSPLPALVPIGRAGDDSADVLLNLEAAGAVFVTGASERAAGVVRALATSMTGLSWMHAVSVVLVGLGEALHPVDRVRCVDSIGEVLDELRSAAQVMGSVTNGSDPFPARVRGHAGEGWAPTAVCCPRPLEACDRAEVMRLARPGSGIVAVLSGDPEQAAWVIDVDIRPMTVQPLRLSVEPTMLDAADFENIGELYRLAQDDSGAGHEEAPYDRLTISADRSGGPGSDGPTGSHPSTGKGKPRERPDGTPADTAVRQKGEGVVADATAPEAGLGDPTTPDTASADQGDALRPPPAATPSSFSERGILVRVLGTVEIEGSVVFKRAKSRELAVYLALHPNGVGEAELDEALWPSREGRLVSASTRDSTVSVARTALGGPSRLLPAQGQGREKRYRLSDAVDTDWERFCELHRSGRAQRSADALCAALELVRGRPFEGVIAARSYGWVHTEGHARHIEAEVADAADLAAGLLLDDRRALDARWAARQGLLADPYIERLWIRLMQAADVLGDSQDIERIMDEMDAVLELDGDFSELHPNTIDVYQRLSRRHRLPI